MIKIVYVVEHEGIARGVFWNKTQATAVVRNLKRYGGGQSRISEHPLKFTTAQMYALVLNPKDNADG